MHKQARDFVARTVASLSPRTRVVEIGSYNVNGTVRDLFGAAESYVGIDARPGPGVDVVADGAWYEPDEPVDTVVSTEALEHAPNAPEIILNAFLMLEPGGVLILTAAGPERTPHNNDGRRLGGDEYYRNIAPAELSIWLGDAGFEDIRIEHDPRAGDVYALAVKPGEDDE